MKLSYYDYNEIPKVQLHGIYEVENYGTFYWVNGKRHREDGPAEEYFNGTKFWYINDELHRLDGPAIEYSYGDKHYRIEGEIYTKDEFETAVYLYLNNLQDYL